MPEECGDRLPGLYADLTLVCRLDAGHSSCHQDAQLGPVIEWTPNAIRLIEENAA